MKKSIALIFCLLGLHLSAFAVEGMWIPSLIDMFHSDMQTYGLKLTAEQVYSTNQSSLKDAIVQFNGGCTAEIVSDKGLLLTNHHCGLDAIQRHSSVENDYITDGFWAADADKELSCSWLRVTFVREITDVTAEIMKGTDAIEDAADKMKIIQANIKALIAERNTSEFIKTVIKPFNMGNQYFMLVTEDFKDIRLVGAPPSAIGKYGGDTDNWVWPRHTGDFSVFRIYANEKNEASKYDKANKTYTPDHFLPISMKPKKEGDFTMVYGFPGHTDQHFCSDKLDFYIQKERPARIQMRQTTLDLMKPAMNKDKKVLIQYTSKQARIANAWKKWIGQLGGLKELNALEKKRSWEKEYIAKSKEKKEWNQYGNVLGDMSELYKNDLKYEFARSMFIEYFFVGPEFLKFSYKFEQLAFHYDELEQKGKLEELIKELQGSINSFYKNYNQPLDYSIYQALTPAYINYVDKDLLPDGFEKNWAKNGEKIFKKSIIMNQQKITALFKNFSKNSVKKLQKDPALALAVSLFEAFNEKTRAQYGKMAKKEAALMQKYVEGILTMFPNKKTWADANSTMRITYGKIEGSAPVDGIQYLHYTTADGIMQKYDAENPDFELPQRFLDLYKAKDFGDYTQDGKLWVCFTASNHTTGGNSGSPVIDAEGRLMGINFDRSWESTMSDFMFDESRCRNIAVDIRYVLWVIDKYGKAGYLVKEMKLEK